MTKARGLKAAIEGGAAHVHITEHLDLRGLPALAPQGCDDCVDGGSTWLFPWTNTLQSITVRNCKACAPEFGMITN